MKKIITVIASRGSTQDKITIKVAKGIIIIKTIKASRETKGNIGQGSTCDNNNKEGGNQDKHSNNGHVGETNTSKMKTKEITRCDNNDEHNNKDGEKVRSLSIGRRQSQQHKKVTNIIGTNEQ